MTPLIQSNGRNCFITCIASILEVSPTMFPDLNGLWGRNRLDRVNQPLSRFGYCVVKIPYPQSNDVSRPRGYALCAGVSERGTRHCVVWKDGKIVHDPHPKGKGLISREWLYLLVPLDPSEMSKK